jgi:hypothetical protein
MYILFHFPRWKRETRDGIFKLLRNPGIDSKELISPAYVAWRAGARICRRLRSPEIDPASFCSLAGQYDKYRVVVPARRARNRLLGSLNGLQIRARYTTTLFLVGS